MPRPNSTARFDSLRLRVAATLVARAGKRPRRPRDPGAAAAPALPDPAPRPLIGGAAAEVD